MSVVTKNKNNPLQLDNTSLQIMPVVPSLETTAAALHFPLQNVQSIRLSWKRVGEAALILGNVHGKTFSFLFLRVFSVIYKHLAMEIAQLWRSLGVRVGRDKSEWNTLFRSSFILLCVHTLIKSRMRKRVTFLFLTGVLYLRYWNKMRKSSSHPDKVKPSTHRSKIKCSFAIQSQSNSCLATTTTSSQHTLCHWWGDFNSSVTEA